MRKYISCLLILLTACVEPFEIETTPTETTLVIEAKFTDEVKSHQVTISEANALTSLSLDQYALDTTVVSPVTGAKVWLEDQNGSQTSLAEGLSGRYLTAADFIPEFGLTYTLHVNLIDGNNYVSDPESLLPEASLDSVYTKFVTLPSTENQSLNKGMQFFVDAHNPFGGSSWFRYEWIDLYQFSTPEISKFVQVGTGVVPRENPIHNCYRWGRSADIILATTQGLSEPEISELPLTFLDEDVVLPLSNYSLRVRQYSISSDAYQYYRLLRENNVGSGSLFDSQKGVIRGNIHSETDSDETVLGYFEIANVSERLFNFKDTDFPSNFNPTYPADCIIQEGPGIDTRAWLILDIISFSPFQARWINAQCADCRFYGGLELPPIWTE